MAILAQDTLSGQAPLPRSRVTAMVEPDNLAGWEPENKTGFHITRADQLRFNRWVARQVHDRGMAVR
jgi:Glycoside-hydrolase family GH114